MTKPRYHCMTCGMDFDEKPVACPSCGQASFADRSDSETDVCPVHAEELSEEEEDEEDTEDAEQEQPAPRRITPHVPGDTPPRRRKTARTLKRKR
jgi:hypothetical protein